MTRKEINTYTKAKVENMSQQELIVFLYDSAIRLMEEGKERIDARDVPGAHEKLNRARNIFLHLLATLNIEEGGEFAGKLSSLYSYFVEKITIANATNNKQELDDIMPLVVEIKESWENMKVENNKKTPSSGINNKPENQMISMEA